MMKKSTHQAGFTIIELLIATAVLSTILVFVTVVMVNIGSLYYKGINQARVQDNVRSIADEAARYIQLNDQPPTPPVNGSHNTQLVCIGPVRYTYVLGVQIGHTFPGGTPASPVYHQVLWRDNNPTPGSCPTQIDPSNSLSPDVDLTSPNLANLDPSGTELIADNSRLTQFSLTTNSPSTVTVGEAYGDDDLLCNPTTLPTSCTNPANMSPPNTNPTAVPPWSNYVGSILCKGGKGDQFCSTAHITTSAVGRIAGGSF